MEVDVEAVARAALSCREVAALSGGAVGEAATYLPARRVTGVRVAGGEVAVHVVARWGTPLPDVAAAVRRAVAPVTGHLPTAAYVEDILLPEEEAEASTGEGAGVATP